MRQFKLGLIATALLSAAAVQASPVVVGNTSATDLANAIAGSGITISNAVFSTDSTGTLGDVAGTFTNGGGAATGVGFNNGIVLTTGTIACAGGTNTTSSCGSDAAGASATFSSLKFDFTSTSGQIFFNYVFGSDEYNEFVNQGFNDQFELLLNGVNIAQLPGAGGVVSIDNVNCGSNNSFYRNNEASVTSCPFANLDVQYDGMTTVLTANASLLAGTNTFEFRIFDRGDSFYDSGVYIKAGSFSSTNPDLPEPASVALVGLALAAAGLARRKAA